MLKRLTRKSPSRVLFISLVIAVTGAALAQFDSMQSALVFLAIAGLTYGTWLILPE